ANTHPIGLSIANRRRVRRPDGEAPPRPAPRITTSAALIAGPGPLRLCQLPAVYGVIQSALLQGIDKDRRRISRTVFKVLAQLYGVRRSERFRPASGAPLPHVLRRSTEPTYGESWRQDSCFSSGRQGPNPRRTVKSVRGRPKDSQFDACPVGACPVGAAGFVADAAVGAEGAR